MSHKLTMRTSSLALLLAYGINLGCSSVREVPSSEAIDNDKVYSLKLKSGEVIQFNDDGGKVNAYQGTIVGRTVHGETVSITLNDVQSMRTDRTDTTETVAWTVVGIGVVVAAVVYLISRIYVWP